MPIRISPGLHWQRVKLVLPLADTKVQSELPITNSRSHIACRRRTGVGDRRRAGRLSTAAGMVVRPKLEMLRSGSCVGFTVVLRLAVLLVSERSLMFVRWVDGRLCPETGRRGGCRPDLDGGAVVHGEAAAVTGQAGA